ncbi:MAG: glycosyltransferase family A protein [Halioglobus sp.]
MNLSIILISYDMAREIPRTLQSLSRGYQFGAQNLDYEVLLVDNGSPVPLNELTWSGIDVPVRLIRIEGAPPSPAKAINIALEEAAGEIICLMIDGAHILTPGVFRMARSAFQAFNNAVVAIRYFYLGIDEQTVSVARGYNQEAEDKLLERILWPQDGYRLYEISTPLRSGASRLTWFNRMFESNCLFMRRSLFQTLGGAAEEFDYPGGGFLNLDIFKRAMETPGVTPVQIVGEGSFHQLHGGITTNSDGDERAARLAKYREQYVKIRGHEELMADVSFIYMGHMPTTASNITAVERRRARAAGKLVD